MPRSPTPASVALVARTHWFVGGTIAIAAAALFGAARSLLVELNPLNFTISFSLAGFYLLTGTLVWFGQPPGRFLSYACSMIYLPRQNFGMHIFRIMGSREFKAHFASKRKDATYTPTGED